MEDYEIIELYWKRNERAIEETDKKYGKYCNSIAFNILENFEDSTECLNDTYLNTWKSIPPNKPNVLKLFIGKITRNLALNKYEKKKIKQTNETTMEKVLIELQECISENYVEQHIQYNELVDSINLFLDKISSNKRKIFLERYWYLKSIKQISIDNNLNESNVKVILHRTRIELKKHLEEEKIYE